MNSEPLGEGVSSFKFLFAPSFLPFLLLLLFSDFNMAAVESSPSSLIDTCSLLYWTLNKDVCLSFRLTYSPSRSVEIQGTAPSVLEWCHIQQRECSNLEDKDQLDSKAHLPICLGDLLPTYILEMDPEKRDAAVGRYNRQVEEWKVRVKSDGGRDLRDAWGRKRDLSVIQPSLILSS